MLKIKEKRKERKQKKELAEWEQVQVAEYRQKAAASEEVRAGRVGGVSGSGGRRRSESLEREGEDVPPPRYEDVVGEARRDRVSGDGRKGGEGGMRST